MARLKVFVTQAGFYDLAVAASSQPKALAAWGVRQNLFAEGMARVTTERAVVEAALAKPGVVLRRPLGTTGAFGEEPALPMVKGRVAKRKAGAQAKARAVAGEAKTALKRADKEHAAERAALTRARATLDARLATEDATFRKRRAALKKKATR